MTDVGPAATSAEALEAQAVAFEQAAVAETTAPLAEQVAVAVATIAAAWAGMEAAQVAAGAPVRGLILSGAAAGRLATATRRALGAVTVDLRPALERQVLVGFELGRTHALETGPVDDLGDVEAVVPDLGGDQPPEPEPRIDPLPEPAPDRRRPRSRLGDAADIREAAERAAARIDLDDLPQPTVTLDDLDTRDPDLVETVVTIDVRAKDRLDGAVALTDELPMTRRGDIDQVIRQAESAVHGARRDTVWATDRAMAAGLADVADDIGGGLLWLAERDACLICQGFAGQVAYDGEPFPSEMFADVDPPVVPYPPAHPSCRCRVRPYSGPPPTRDISADDPASALAREARRSVARGWSAYDSRAARLRAVERLIEEGADLPKSVVDRARRNLAAGEFARDGGRFPDQGPGQGGPPPRPRPVRPGGGAPAKKAPAARPARKAATPPPTPPPSRLARAAASGERTVETITDGGSGAKVEKVTFNDGTVAIRKTIVDYGRFTADHQAKAEQAGALVGRALGLPAPDVERTADNQVLMEFMPGTPADAVDGFDWATWWDSDDGALLAFADMLTENNDRHGGNFLVDDTGRISGIIDHSLSFDWTFTDPAEPVELLLTSPDTVTEARRRIEALRPDFERIGASDWWSNIMTRLDSIDAQGTRRVIP